MVEVVYSSNHIADITSGDGVVSCYIYIYPEDRYCADQRRQTSDRSEVTRDLL